MFLSVSACRYSSFFFQAEDGIRDLTVTGVQTCALPISAKHGDRSFCTSGQTQITVGGNTLNQCAGGGACTALLPTGAQGDANVIGTCGAAGFNYLPVSTSCLATNCGWTGAAGIPAVSSNYLVSANFFRTRDTLRQDMI